MAKKKGGGKKKKGKTYKIQAPKPKKITFWRKLTADIKVLFGEHNPSRLTVVHNEVLSKRTPAIAIVAPIYANLKSKVKGTKWTPKDIASIKLNGCYLHAKTRIILKLKNGDDNRIRPNCIYPTFLLEHSYVSLLIGNPCLTGNLTTPEDNLYSEFEHLIRANDGIVCNCNCKFTSYWFDGKNFYTFCPEAQKRGKLNEITFVLKSKSLQTLVEYIKDYLQLKGVFTLYCVKILSVRDIPLDLNKIIRERKKILKSIAGTGEQICDQICEKPPFVDTSPPAPSSIEIEKKIAPAQIDVPERVFSKDYNNKTYEDRGFLSGNAYVKIPDKILHTNIACAIFLNSIKAMIWTKQGIQDILDFGNKLYRNSARNRLLDHPIWTQRIAMPIEFADKSYNVVFDKKIYGEVTSEEPHIYTLRRGIQSFFKEHDLGLVWGPQTQLIWSESNLYFTFSPKERDKVGRKWTKMLSSFIDPNQNEGAACVSWFKTPTLLAEALIGNIPLKHRKDPFRIVKLKIQEIYPVSQDYNNWKAIGEFIWRIIGDKTICNYLLESEIDLKFIKGFCIAAMNSLYCLITDCNEWTSKDIDDILEFGNQYYLESIELKPNLAREFDFKELKKTFTMREKRFQVLIIPNAVTGFVFYNKGNQLELFAGLKLFFEDYIYGVFIVRDIVIPIWSLNGYFYLLYPYDKIFGKTNDCVCGPETIYSKVYGHAYALRFKNLQDMHKEFLNSLSMEDQDKYSLYSIEGKDRPPLLNYEQFGENGAILRPYDDLHEGHDLFNVRKDKQTYANILTCLCYAFITRPLEWSKDDLLDILRIGDEIYCKLVASLENCKELYFFDTNQTGDNKLSLIVPKIGQNKFTFEENPAFGIFKYIPPQMEEEGMNEDEGDDEAEDADTVYAGDNNDDPMRTNDLKYFVEQMDKNNEVAFVLLDSKFFTIAIWKKDLVYFVFDPKACDANGKLDENRMSKALKQLEGAGDGNEVPDIPHEGSAYVAYFYDKESLVKHILSKVPNEHLNEQIVFNTITIRSLPVPIADLDFKKPESVPFTSLSPNVAIIRATLSQDHPKYINQNKQEAANCLVALIFATMTAANKWNVSILDKILQYGDRLYIKSLEDLKIKDPIKVCSDEKLALEEILEEMYINKIKFKIKLKSKFTNCMVLNGENKELKKNLNALKQVESGMGAVIRIKGYTNAIWRSGPMFFLFDPVKTDPEGNISIEGTSSLMRFAKIDNLCDFLSKKFLCKIDTNSFEILTYEIEKSLPAALPEIYLEKFNFSVKLPSNQVVFVDIGNDMKVLKKTLEPSEMSVPKDYLCLAALVNSTLLYIEFWNASVFKRITLMGYYLFQQLNCKSLNAYEDNEKHLEEINYSIKIDSILCKIVINHVIQTSVRKEFKSVNLYLKHGIETCFAERSYAIITGTNKSYALWKDEPYFYMFWINEQIGKIMVQRAKEWNVFFNIISNEADIDAPSTYQVKYVQISNIRMWDVCDEIGKLPSGFLDPFSDICRECHYNDFQKNTDKIQRFTDKHANFFMPIRQGIDILSSNIPLERHKFYRTENYFPNVKATCIVAAGMSYIKIPANWTKKTLSKIIHSGNELFMNSVAIKRTNNLDITNIEQSFNLYNVTLQIVALPPTQELAEMDNLVTVLTYILRKHRTAYLIFPERICLTLMLQDTLCYVFYPGSNEKFSEEIRCESACLLRFDNLIRAINFILLKESDISNSLFVGPIVVMGRW